MAFETYDVARLRRTIDNSNLVSDAIGTILIVHESDPPEYEVEFCDDEGMTLALLTLGDDDLEPAVTEMYLSRPTQFSDRRRDYRVHVDGAPAGVISDGGTLVLPLLPGTHTVRLTIDWMSSREVPLRCAGERETHLECGNALGVGSEPGLPALATGFLNFLRVSAFERDGYLYLKPIRVFRFHEDDEGQRQILPIGNLDYCRRALAAADAHAREHAAPDGAGWTSMYSPGAPDELLRDLAITSDRFENALAPHGSRFDRLESPLSEIDEQLGIRRTGFGPTSRTGIVARLDGETVSTIWCQPFATRAEDIASMAAMLAALNRLSPMLLIDWEAGKIVDLSSAPDIAGYLSGQ